MNKCTISPCKWNQLGEQFILSVFCQFYL